MMQNPVMRNAIEMYQKKDTQGLNELASNLCKEKGTTMEEMTRLTFSPDNLQLLCVAHHQKVHKELGKNSKANRKQRREDAFNRWIEHLKNYTNE